jgi:hypothetical protein
VSATTASAPAPYAAAPSNAYEPVGRAEASPAWSASPSTPSAFGSTAVRGSVSAGTRNAAHAQASTPTKGASTRVRGGTGAPSNAPSASNDGTRAAASSHGRWSEKRRPSARVSSAATTAKPSIAVRPTPRSIATSDANATDATGSRAMPIEPSTRAVASERLATNRARPTNAATYATRAPPTTRCRATPPKLRQASRTP